MSGVCADAKLSVAIHGLRAGRALDPFDRGVDR